MNQKFEYQRFLSKRNFGIEIEVNPTLSKLQLGEIVRSVDTSHYVEVTPGEEEGWMQSTGDCWNVKFDRSCGWEVASYKASGIADIQIMGKVTNALSLGGAEADSRCGFHVHANISDFSVAQAGCLYANWIKIEDMLAQACPSRRRNNTHCKYLRRKKVVDYNRKYEPEKFFHMMKPTSLAIHENTEKKVTLNLVGYCNWLNCNIYSRSTAELRLPEGSLSSSDVMNWTTLFVHFVDRAKHLPMPENFEFAGLDETLKILGLEGEGSFFILDENLRSVKAWLLRRWVKYGTGIKSFMPESSQKFIRKEAGMKLERMGEFWNTPRDMQQLCA